MEPASPSVASPPAEEAAARRRLPEELKLRRRTLETVLEQCQRALEMIREVDLGEVEEGANSKEGVQEDEGGEADGHGGGDEGAQPPPPSDADYETDEVRGDLAAHLLILWSESSLEFRNWV